MERDVTCTATFAQAAATADSPPATTHTLTITAMSAIRADRVRSMNVGATSCTLTTTPQVCTFQTNTSSVNVSLQGSFDALFWGGACNGDSLMSTVNVTMDADKNCTLTVEP